MQAVYDIATTEEECKKLYEQTKEKVRKPKDLVGRSAYGLNNRNHLIDSRQAIKLARRGESPSLTINISYKLICVKDALETGNIFYCDWISEAGILLRSESEE